jgi:hypothetical protein
MWQSSQKAGREDKQQKHNQLRKDTPCHKPVTTVLKAMHNTKKRQPVY